MEFDVTQSEVVGNIFANASIIRFIQATPASNRDSVPPTSALRFDPNTTRKREREGSARPNGVSPNSTWKSNKRQKVLELDPDEPLPSRENESGQRAGFVAQAKMTPESQVKDTESSNGKYNTSRQVRQDLPQIPETPTPSPPRELHRSRHLAKATADQQVGQSASRSQPESSKGDQEVGNSSPLGKVVERAQSHGSQRTNSGTYHISRPTERGRSVSTAATSPLSVDHHAATSNGVTPSSKRTKADGTPRHREKLNQSPNEDSIYDNIVSDDEGAEILRKKKASLRIRNSPKSGLPGMDWANNKFSTPPNGKQLPSHKSLTGELPLTPNSKEREKRQQEKRKAEETKAARKAVAEAAELRRTEAEEARQAEEARIADDERAKREEQERLEIEDFQKGEAKRQAAIAKANRLQKEKEDKEKKEALEQRRIEEQRIAKAKAESERLAKETAETEEKKKRERRNTEEMKRIEEAAMKKKSLTPEAQRHSHSSSPILPRATPHLPPNRSRLRPTSQVAENQLSSPRSLLKPYIARPRFIQARPQKWLVVSALTLRCHCHPA